MKIKELSDALILLRPFYAKGDDSYCIGAEHDAIYLYATDIPLPTDVIEKMISLGWFQEDAEYADDEDFAAKHYAPEESWTHYT